MLDDLISRSWEPLPPYLEKWAQGEPYRRFLFNLCREREIKVAVELGVERGETTALLAAACQQVIAVDCRETIRFHGALEAFPNIHFLWCDTLGAAEVVRDMGLKINLVFQDSSHHAEHSWQEWLYWNPLLADGWVWVCDDITSAFKMSDEPRGMVEYFERLPGQKQLFPGLHIGSTIGVVVP